MGGGQPAMHPGSGGRVREAVFLLALCALIVIGGIYVILQFAGV
jgi:hypothetical protein